MRLIYLQNLLAKNSAFPPYDRSTQLFLALLMRCLLTELIYSQGIFKYLPHKIEVEAVGFYSFSTIIHGAPFINILSDSTTKFQSVGIFERGKSENAGSLGDLRARKLNLLSLMNQQIKYELTCAVTSLVQRKLRRILHPEKICLARLV